MILKSLLEVKFYKILQGKLEKNQLDGIGKHLESAPLKTHLQVCFIYDF